MAEPSVGWSGSFDLSGRGIDDIRITAAGLDLVDVTKLSSARTRWSGRLEARLFTARERATLADDDSLVNLAFGIKESVIKLLGGLPPGGGFHDIELARTDSGWHVGLHGRLAPSDRATTQTVIAGSVHPGGLPPLVWAAMIESSGGAR
jgi:holo-[acyl-carrier protein] synthase